MSTNAKQWASEHDGHGGIYIGDAEGRQVGFVSRHPDQEANARLIAAAPELLEALKEVARTEMFLPDHPQRFAAYKNARDAIAKATGSAA
jgi:hypothetical protein